MSYTGVQFHGASSTLRGPHVSALVPRFQPSAILMQDVTNGSAGAQAEGAWGSVFFSHFSVNLTF